MLSVCSFSSVRLLVSLKDAVFSLRWLSFSCIGVRKLREVLFSVSFSDFSTAWFLVSFSFQRFWRFER